MKKSTIIIIILLVVTFITGGIILSNKKVEEAEINLEERDAFSVGTDDHVKGTVEGVEPELYIFEYADYQCPGCAATNPWINEILESYNGKVAVVYRSFLLSYHQNAKAAASAAEAAGLQGYWKAYADLLFANQSEWDPLSGSGRKEKFIEYFETVSKGEGDSKKFAEDMASEAVKAKINLDVALGKKVGVSATPAFYMDGKEIDWTGVESASTKAGFIEYFKTQIDAKLGI